MPKTLLMRKTLPIGKPLPRLFLAGLLVGLGLLAAACNDDKSENYSTAEEGCEDRLTVATDETIEELMQEEFQAGHPDPAEAVEELLGKDGRLNSTVNENFTNYTGCLEDYYSGKIGNWYQHVNCKYVNVDCVWLYDDQ